MNLGTSPAIPGQPHILVADDDADTRFIISKVLTKNGCVVDEVADGELAWAALHHAAYDLLVTDNKMPRLTGTELIGRMRQEGLNLPVVMASGSFLPGGARPDPALQVAAVLAKPFGLSDLLDSVRHALAAVTAGATFGPSNGCAYEI